MATSLRHFHVLFVVLPVLAFLLVEPMPARAESFRITARATPTRVVFGADNRVAINVTVADSLNNPVPDGTQVFFYTTLGSIPPIAYTRMGGVDVLLENNAGPGRAFITITVGGSRQTIRVDYLGQNGEVPALPARTSYRVTAEQVYYSVDKRIFDLRDKATFRTDAFTVTADAMQFDVRQELLRAQNNVIITAGDATLLGDKCQIEVSAQRGIMVQTSPEYRFVSFVIPALVAKDDETARHTGFYTPLEPKPTSTWIICHRANIFPNEQIQFRAPQFYMNNVNRRLFSLPYHVINLRTSDAGTFFNSKITLTSDAGVDVDFPIYYAATSHHVGSLHLREVGKGSGFYRGSTGLQLGVEEEYLVGNEGDGSLYLDDLTRETRSAAWSHAHDFGKTRVHFNAAYDRYSLQTPYTSRLDLGVNRMVGAGNLDFTTNWSAFQGNQDGSAELSASLPSLELGKTGLSLGFSPYLGYSHAVTTATDSTPQATTGTFYQGLVAGLGFPAFRLLGGTVALSSTDELVHKDDDTLTNYFDASIGYRRKLGNTFAMGVNYSYGNITAGAASTSKKLNQRVSAHFNGTHPNRWDLFTYASYDLEEESFFTTGGLTYLLTKRHDQDSPGWFLRYRGSLTSAPDTLSGELVTSDHIFTLGRNVGIYTLLLHYSPTGNTGVTGIGTGAGKMWAIELARQGF